MGIVCFLGLLALVAGLVIMSNRQAQQRRAPLLAQIEGMRAQMQAFVRQGQGLDAKTAERVMEAQKSVNEKLDQAAALLKTAVKENHYARIGRILTQVQAKLGNVQASVGRAQARADERTQRQTERQAQKEQETAARRVGSFGNQSVQTVPRRGSFAPPAQVTSAATAWNTIPPRERGVCFFCSRPCLLSELTPVTVPIAGMARRVLACPQDFATVQAGSLPQIRAFSVNSRLVPWYAYNRYNPYNDFYANGYGVNYYVDLYPYDAFDAGYWNFNGPYGYDNNYNDNMNNSMNNNMNDGVNNNMSNNMNNNMGGNDGGYSNGGGNNQPYNFTPDTEAAQDYFSGAAAGAAAGVMGTNFDPNNPNFDPQHGGMDFASGSNDPNNSSYPDNAYPDAGGPDRS